MAATFYYKLIDGIWYYNDTQVDNTWTVKSNVSGQDLLRNESYKNDIVQILPYTTGLAISGLTSLQDSFNSLANVTKIDLSGFDMSTVTPNVSAMCYNCSKLIDFTWPTLGGIGTNNESYLAFYNAGTGQYVFTMHGNLSNATNIPHLCEGIATTTIEFANDMIFNSAVSDISGICFRCPNLRTVDLSKIHTTTGTLTITRAFDRCYALEYLTLPQMNCSDTSINNNYGPMCQAGTAGKTLTVYGDTSNCTSMNGMFSARTNYRSYWSGIDLSHLDLSNCKSFARMFTYTAFEEIDLSHANATGVTDIANIANNVSELTKLDLSGITTADNAWLTHFASYCPKLSTLILPNLTGSTTQQSYTGVLTGSGDATNCPRLNISGDLSGTTTLRGLFGGRGNTSSYSVKYTTLNLTGITFNTGHIVNLANAFANCVNLTTIYCNEDLYTDGVTTYTNDTFAGCSNLVGGAGTTWDSNNVSGVRAVMDSGETKPGYLSQLTGINVSARIPNSCTWTLTKVSNTVYSLDITPEDGYILNQVILQDSHNHTIDIYYPRPNASLVITLPEEGIFNAIIVCINGESPYTPQDPSDTGGGDGNYDDTSDTIDDTESINPNVNNNAGMFTVYSPTDTELGNLASTIYNNTFLGQMQTVVNTIGSVGGKVTDYILSLFKLPFEITKGNTKQLSMGWYGSTVALSLPLANTTGTYIDMGSLTIEPYWNNYLDYSSRIQIFLPYVGYQDLDVTDVMGKTLSLMYLVDYVSGDCTAQIYVDGDIHYQFKGNMAYRLPVGSDNFSDIIQQGIALGTSMITGGLAYGAAGTALEASYGLSKFSTTASESIAQEGLAADSASLAKASASKAANQFTTTVGGDVVRGGCLGSNNGWFGCQVPYVIINRPRLSLPDNYAHYHGFPCNMTKRLGDLQGYTEVSDIHLDNLGCTGDEEAMIDKLLHSGVIINNWAVNNPSVFTIYKQLSDVNTIGKDKSILTTINDIKLKQQTSLLKPTFILSGLTMNTVANMNYIYYPEANRYYLIDSIDNVRDDIWELHCTVDVLETYKGRIAIQSGVISRQEYVYNLLLNDGSLVSYSNPQVVTKKFPVSFKDKGYSYILLGAGS